jgi:diguanylate cyclase (GGDEF)-like protein/PAS domain S-box-containing protein
MSVFDASGKCLQINEAYQKLFDVSRDEVLGKRFGDLPFSGSTNDYLEAIRTRQSRQCELQTSTSTQDAIWLDLRFLPFEIEGQINLLVQCIDLTEQKRLNSELEALAFNDSLTGLPNRRLFFDRLDRALSRCRRNKNCGAVLLLDLDRFKELNDTWGHEVGDKLLVEVARRLSANVKSTDTVARLGGDEFVLILEDIGDNVIDATDHVARKIDYLQRRLSESYELGGARFLGSASIGFALFEGVEEEDAAFLLRKADASMYAVKKSQSS